MSNAQPPRTFADSITVPCPACKGAGEVKMRIQYTDRRRPCAEAMRTCPICNGFKVVSAAEDAAFARKQVPTRAPTDG
jgi:hypothetical protein